MMDATINSVILTDYDRYVVQVSIQSITLYICIFFIPSGGRSVVRTLDTIHPLSHDTSSCLACYSIDLVQSFELIPVPLGDTRTELQSGALCESTGLGAIGK